MGYVGNITSITSNGFYVYIPRLRAVYGPLDYVGEVGDYAEGNRVALMDIGSDDYVVIGPLKP